ncbi:2-iminobutanoate/2-iminopropanoate deaminase [Arenibacter sp. ARW7G5Y1]|nr:2-iminobutanoate/2-iminopropanoate deaminase [Arenibacter sp. ARW7G5Y1]|tara:strand:- start:144 stop:563 length:420 start_codon:yes stop_codon:yes gene_type:complete
MEADKLKIKINYNMKKIITTTNAPAPIGPYNQAVMAGNTLYISGQIPIDPKTGELVSGDIKKETEQSMQNLKAILTEAGMTFENVVKSSIFVKDMHQFSQINEVYSAYFDADTAPARETVEVANLPKFVNVEISMIAIK